MVLLWTHQKRAWQDLIKEQAREKLVRAARRSVTRILDHFFTSAQHKAAGQLLRFLKGFSLLC